MDFTQQEAQRLVDTEIQRKLRGGESLRIRDQPQLLKLYNQTLVENNELRLAISGASGNRNIYQNFLKAKEQAGIKSGQPYSIRTEYKEGKPTSTIISAFSQPSGNLLQTTGATSISPTTTSTISTGKITPLQKPKGFLENTQYFLTKQRTELTTKELRGKSTFGTQVGLFGVGVGSTLVGAGLGVKQLVTHPITTIKKAPEFISSIPTQGKEFGETIRTSPSLAMGQVAGNIILLEGPKVTSKGVLKTSDYFRTRGVSELTKENIIAPEYFKGQKYPGIKRGQTAGQLLEEFKPMKSLGETKPAGFTSSPSPLKGTEKIIVGRGSSELPGLYQAPKLSPAFLKISSEEKKLFTFNPLGETMRPSIFRITPTEFKLTPGVKSSQRNIALLKPTKQFFEKAPKGKSYVAFVKTEKESIIPFGTQLIPTGKKGFIKFEGRKIPIQGFETVSGEGKKIFKPSKIFTTSDVSDLSSRRIGSKAYFNPSSALSITRSRGNSLSSSKIFDSSSNILKVSSTSSYINKPSKGGISTGYGKGGSSFGPTFYGKGYDGVYRKGYGRYISGPISKPFKKNFGQPPKLKLSVSKIKSFRVPRSPSLFAIGENITSKGFGRAEFSGLGIRPIIISGRKRKRRK